VSEFNSAFSHTINSGSVIGFKNNYATETHFIDGQALTPSSFGETDTITGVWKPKKYAGTYGTNGFFLNFADNSGTTSTTLGKDSSGNGNNWTPNNFSVTAGAGNDSLIDTPTPYADGGNGRGNYCTLNPLDKNSSQAPKNGNLDFDGSVATGGLDVIAGTMRVTTGKWYWESTITAVGSIAVAAVGVTKIQSIGRSTSGGLGGVSGECAYLPSGNKQIDGSSTAYGSIFTTGDVIGVALDCDAGTVTFYKNNTSQGAITYAVGGGLSPAFGQVQGYGASQTSNFGQRPFAYTPPSGFKALNTGNLPEPTIKKPGSYMDTLLWTGDGTQTRALTGLNFQPDLVWMKIRANTPQDHQLYDSVRGAGGGKCLASNTTAAEGTVNSFPDSDYGYVASFDSTGFSLNDGAVATTGGYVNFSGRTYVAWCWDESATPGFDIVTYTGTGSNTTVAHSLGVAPSMIIYKRRSATDSWIVYHTSIGTANNLVLNNTNAQAANGSVYWNSTAPTSTVFSVGTDSAVNASASTYVAYLWSEVAGFSRFGSYRGTNVAEGPFVYCGFRPKYVLIKNTGQSFGWVILDSARNTYNLADDYLLANASDTEVSDTTRAVDFLSNGFKVRGDSSFHNSSSYDMIFCAFAEHPFKYSLAR
jgi:hypothetical protein